MCIWDYLCTLISKLLVDKYGAEMNEGVSEQMK